MSANPSKITKKEGKVRCYSLNCELCSKGNRFGPFHMTLRGWKDRLIESMSILERSYNREWLSLQSEILPFIENHWSILWPPCEKKRSF